MQCAKLLLKHAHLVNPQRFRCPQGPSDPDAHQVASDVIAGGLRALASGLSRFLRWRSPCDVSKLC